MPNRSTARAARGPVLATGKLGRWGNSPALRVTLPLLRAAGVSATDEYSVHAKAGQITLVFKRPPRVRHATTSTFRRYTLAQVLADKKPVKARAIADRAVGRERL